jgi:hypothetical protein
LAELEHFHGRHYISEKTFNDEKNTILSIPYD